MAVYHGGNWSPLKMDPGKAVFNTIIGGSFGTHFGALDAAEERLVNRYDMGYLNPSKASIVSAFIDLKKPLTMPDLEEWDVDDVVRVVEFSVPGIEIKKSVRYSPEGDDIEYYRMEDVIDALIGNRYDGVIYTNEFEDKGKPSYIVFSPTQVKSVTENTGAFDPQNPDIRYKRGNANRYGIGSSAVNGEGFADLEVGDTYEKVFRSLTSRTNEEVRNERLGITAKIGSNRNANHLVGKNSAFGDEDAEAYKYAAKNVLALLAKADIGILHRDKKGTRNDYIRAFAPFAFGDETKVATITLRRESAGDRIYTVEAVEVESGDSPRTSRRTAQEAQSPVSLRDRIAYYVGDVKATEPQFLGSETPFSVDELTKRVSDSVVSFRQNTESDIRFKRGDAPDLPRATEDDPNVAFGTKAGILAKTGIEREFARVSDVAVMKEGERRSRIVGEADGIIRKVQRGDAPSSTDLATLIHAYADRLVELDRARNAGEDTEMLEKAVENVADLYAEADADGRNELMRKCPFLRRTAEIEAAIKAVKEAEKSARQIEKQGETVGEGLAETILRRRQRVIYLMTSGGKR